MPKSTIDLLNELLAMHSRSLPVYLASAKPWVRINDDRSLQVLRNMATDHKRLVERIGQAIAHHGGVPDVGEFPMLYTDMHDLATDYVVRTVRELQSRDVVRIAEITAALAEVPDALAIAQESLGAAKAHLDELDELTRPRLKVVV